MDEGIELGVPDRSSGFFSDEKLQGIVTGFKYGINNCVCIYVSGILVTVFIDMEMK